MPRACSTRKRLEFMKPPPPSTYTHKKKKREAKRYNFLFITGTYVQLSDLLIFGRMLAYEYSLQVYFVILLQKAQEKST